MCFGGCPAVHRRTARVLGALGHILANRELRWRTFANMIPRRTTPDHAGPRRAEMAAGAHGASNPTKVAQKRGSERERRPKKLLKWSEGVIPAVGVTALR